MYVLVKFENCTTAIYPDNKVKFRENNNCVVKHKGGKYEAAVLLMHGKLNYHFLTYFR